MLFKYIIKYRKIVIAITIVFVICFGFFAKNITINSDTTSYLPKTDSVVRLFNHISAEYGGSSLAIIAIESENIFTPEIIEQINLLTQQFKLIEGVADVISLTNIIDIKKSPDGIDVGKLIDEYHLPQTDQDLEGLKNYVLSKNMYRGHIVSEDARSTLMIVRLSEDFDQTQIVRQIKTIADSLPVNGKIYFAGMPFQVLEINDIIRADLKLLIPIVGLLIALLLLLSFRSLPGVAIPLLSVSFSIVVTLGMMSLLKVPLTIISNIIPVILFTVGSAYSIHVINKYNENKFASRFSGSKDLGLWLREISLPVTLAAITTVAGFIAFIFGSYLTMIKEFGVFSGVGIFLAAILSLTFVPALLSVLPKRNHKTDLSVPVLNQKNRPTTNRPAFVSSLFTRCESVILKNTKLIVVLTIIVALISIFGIPRIKRASDLVGFFKSSSQIRISEQFMKNNFGGSVPIQILVSGDIQDPLVLKEMKKITDFLQSQQDIYNPQSIADLIEEMSYVIGEGKIIPDSKAKVANLWFLLEGEEVVNQMVNHDKSEAVIQAMVVSTQAEPSRHMIENIRAFLNRADTTIACFALTGSPVIYDRLDKSLVKSQFQSLIIAILLVFICLTLMLGSFWGGLIGLAPILLTLLIIFGFMGYAKIPLDVATVLVGSVSIGIGIDYSIHFLNRYRKELADRKNRSQALHQTFKTSGRAILINVLAVTGGFLVLLFANLIPLQRFGMLVAITMVGSGLSTLTLLPALILISKHNLTKTKERNNEKQ
ncbi:MAG: RND family transporter [Candidatus Latescibacteria bacterium]|nr:RND family transporter [Candidatus Latescibacterota bacterium]